MNELERELIELRKELATYKATGKAILLQNQPNPFTKSTVIYYEVHDEAARKASIQITTQKGEVIANYPVAALPAGQLVLDANTLAAGTYIYTLFVDGVEMDSRRMTLSE